MATELEVNDAKVRSLEALSTLLEVLTEVARAGLKEISDRNSGATEGGDVRRGRS